MKKFILVYPLLSRGDRYTFRAEIGVLAEDAKSARSKVEEYSNHTDGLEEVPDGAWNNPKLSSCHQMHIAPKDIGAVVRTKIERLR